MNPRVFLDFFRTRTGKLLLFATVMSGGSVLYFTRSDKKPPGLEVTPIDLRPSDNTNSRPQVVETIQRGFSTFRLPPPKPEPPPGTDARTGVEAVPPPPPLPPPPPPLPIGLFAEAPSPTPEPKVLSLEFAPFGRLIACETVITVDSSSIQTPIIGLITEDVFHAGRLIIPAGTEVHGTAATDRKRERLASGNSWTLVWQTGEELRLNGIALDREFDSTTNQVGWGVTDGSAGLRGRLLKSDDMAEIKLFAATVLSGAASALTEKEQTIFGSLDRRSLNNAPFSGAEKVLSVYAQRIYETIQRDGFYVRIPSGKQFYLYVLQTIDRAKARVGAAGTIATTNDLAMQPTTPAATSVVRVPSELDYHPFNP